MKSKSGFTIIELLVVLVIIGLLAGLMSVGYIKIQASSRDAKRKADIVSLVSLLEKYYDKNGEYPTGCSEFPKSQATYCQKNYNATTADPNILAADTTVTALQQLFPSLPNDFGDPQRSNAAYPFGQSNNGFSYHYYYLGQLDSTTTSGSGAALMTSTTWGDGVNCSGGGNQVYIYTPVGALPKSTTFVLGYWSESDQKWYFYQGKHGYELSTDTGGANKARGTTVNNCVFVQ